MQTNSFSKFKQAEIVTAAGYIETSFTRDRPEIAAEYARYTVEYLANFSAKYQEAKALISRKVALANQKEITTLLHTESKTLKPLLRQIQRYVTLAKQQNSALVNVSFPFSAIRIDIDSHDVEGLTENLTLLQDLINQYNEALQTEGLTTEKRTALTNSTNQIYALNQTQNTKMNTVADISTQNSTIYQELALLMSDICATARVHYKSNPVKYKEYSPKDLLTRVRVAHNNGTAGTPTL